MKNLKSLIVVACSVVAFGFFIALDCEEETEDPAAQPAVTEQTPANTKTQNNTLRTIVMQYPGCIKQEDIGAINDYSRNHNHQPYNQTIRKGLEDGSCSIFEKGEQVYINDTGVYIGLLTVKRPGEGVKYWIVKEAVGL